MGGLIAGDLGESLIPDDDSAAAPLLPVVHPLELAGRQLMVLDGDGQAPHSGIERRSLRDGPLAGPGDFAGPAAAEAAQRCGLGGWQGLFNSQADCDIRYAHARNEAGNVGKGIGVTFIVIFWMVTDFFFGLGYGIYRLASRR